MAETRKCNDTTTGLSYPATDYIECILFCMNISVDDAGVILCAFSIRKVIIVDS